MPIGQHTTWIVVDTHTCVAVTAETDRRVSLHFTTLAAARKEQQRRLQFERDKAAREAGSYDLDRYIVVEDRA